jgi:hypothetical protein
MIGAVPKLQAVDTPGDMSSNNKKNLTISFGSTTFVLYDISCYQLQKYFLVSVIISDV